MSVTQALYAFGDDKAPLPETVRLLDEIVTDYLIDTVQTAAKAASVSGRGKVKADDLKFAIRHDEVATGRVRELWTMEKTIKDARKHMDTAEGKVGLERGPGRGRRKKKNDAETNDMNETGMDKGNRDRKSVEEDLDMDDLPDNIDLE